MEKSSKRGKIPQQDWPSIITRYESGETLASIARTYDCSPPAISYIVSRTRARSAAAEAVAEAAARNAPAGMEHQLLKGPSGEMPEHNVPAPGNNIPATEKPHGEPADNPRSFSRPVTETRIVERPADPLQPNGHDQSPGESPQAAAPVANRPPSEANGALLRHGNGQRGDTGPAMLAQTPRAAGAGGAPQNGEQRRTLHLSLSPANGPDGGESPPRNSPSTANSGHPSNHPDRAAPRPAAEQQAFGQPARHGPTGHHPPTTGLNTPPPNIARPIHPPSESPRANHGGAFIDRVLRERVDGDIAAFLTAFDAALDSDTSETRTGLREATDRLLRAGARTRIELERLEARAPLPARDKIGQTAQPLFRQR